jgi:hypothetical protein
MSTVSTYPNSTYIVADAYAATSWTMAAGVITWGSPLAADAQVVTKYNAITKASITTSVAEVPQVTTLTPVAAANSVYTIMIQQYNFSTGRTYTAQYTYTTAAAGDTATTISNAFKNQINADQNIKISTDALGGATVVLTAEAGFPVFTVTILSVGGGLTQVTGTPGVVAVGTPAALALQGITANPLGLYTTVHIEYSPVTGQNIKDPVAVNSVFDLYLEEVLEANYAAVLADITADLDGTDAADAIAII